MANNQKYDIIVQTTQVERERKIKRILDDFRRYYDGWEHKVKADGLTVVSCRHYYYGVSHSQATEMVRILNQSRHKVETQVKIFREGEGKRGMEI